MTYLYLHRDHSVSFAFHEGPLQNRLARLQQKARPQRHDQEYHLGDAKKAVLIPSYLRGKLSPNGSQPRQDLAPVGDSVELNED